MSRRSQDDFRRMHPAVLMHTAYRHAESRVLAHLLAQGFDLTQAQARIAARVAEEGSRITELAERAGVTKQTAGALVQALEHGGYLHRVPDPADARARLVRLAPRGERARTAARQVERQLLEEWRELLGAERLDDLWRSLAVLHGALEP